MFCGGAGHEDQGRPVSGVGITNQPPSESAREPLDKSGQATEQERPVQPQNAEEQLMTPVVPPASPALHSGDQLRREHVSLAVPAILAFTMSLFYMIFCVLTS